MHLYEIASDRPALREGSLTKTKNIEMHFSEVPYGIFSNIKRRTVSYFSLSYRKSYTYMYRAINCKY